MELYLLLIKNLLNWFFKIFSTNSNVNTYEIKILPVLNFSDENKEKIKLMFRKFDRNDYLNFKTLLNNIVYETFELNKKEVEYINSHF